MTPTKAIITIVLIWIITITAWLFEMTSASYECLNKETASMQLKQAKWLKAKVEAKKLVNQWEKMCK